MRNFARNNIQDTSQPMTLYIVRHGQTEENLERILQGHLPGTLTQEGKLQVRCAAERLAGEGVDLFVNAEVRVLHFQM